MGVRSPVLRTFGDDFAWSLLDAAPDGVVIVSSTGEIVFANDQAGSLLGYAGDDLLGRGVDELLPEALRSVHRAHRTRYRATPTPRSMGAGLLLRALRADGSEFPVEISLKPLHLGGDMFVVAGIRDVTERVETEEELRRSREALHQAEQVLAVANDRDRIARDLHDTVIQRLFGAGLNLQAVVGIADERVRGRIETTITDIDTTIAELRTAIFSLQGAGAAPGGLRGRLLDVLTDAEPGLGFEPRLQFEGPVETIDDDVAAHLVPTLREALSNVAHHAQARHARVTVAVSDEVVLTVTDDGIGVPEQVLGGRGLSNLRDRALALGGEFAVVAEPGGGSRLSWRVPVAPPAASPDDDPARQAAET